MPLKKHDAEVFYAKIYAELEKYCTLAIDRTKSTDLKSVIILIVKHIITVRTFKELAEMFFVPYADDADKPALIENFYEFDFIYASKLAWFKRAMVKTIIDVSQQKINAEKHAREDTLESFLAENERIRTSLSITEEKIKINSQKELFNKIKEGVDNYFLKILNIKKIEEELGNNIKKKEILKRLINEINAGIKTPILEIFKTTKENYFDKLFNINQKYHDCIINYIASHVEKVSINPDRYDSQIIIITGSNLTVTSLVNILNEVGHQKITEVRITLTRNFIIDCDLDLPGINLGIQAKKIILHEKYVINTSGRDGKAFDNLKAKNGEVDSKTSVSHGLPGEDGQHGAAGESAGHMTLESDEIIGIKNLSLYANGGNGAKGQDGGDGQDGLNGQDGEDGKAKDNHKKVGNYGYSLEKGTMGKPGYVGGDGGAAGIGGKGGYPGKITLFVNKIGDAYSEAEEINNHAGKDGEDGKPGKGGKGGYDGKDGVDEGYAWCNWVVHTTDKVHKRGTLEKITKKTWYGRKYYDFKVIRSEDDIKHSNKLKKKQSQISGKEGKQAADRKSQQNQAVKKPTIHNEHQIATITEEIFSEATGEQTETLTQRLAFLRGQQQNLFTKIDSERNAINQYLALAEEIQLLCESAIDEIEQNTELQQQILRVASINGQIFLREDVQKELLLYREKSFPKIENIVDQIFILLEKIIKNYPISEEIYLKEFIAFRVLLGQFLINTYKFDSLQSQIFIGKIETIFLYGKLNEGRINEIRKLIYNLLNHRKSIEALQQDLKHLYTNACHKREDEDEFLQLVGEILLDKLKDTPENVEKINKYKSRFLELLEQKDEENHLLPDKVQSLIRQKIIAKDSQHKPIGVLAKVLEQSRLKRIASRIGLTDSHERKIQLKERAVKERKLSYLSMSDIEIKNKKFDMELISLNYLSDEIILDETQCAFEKAILQHNKILSKESLLNTFIKFKDAVNEFLENSLYSLAFVNGHAEQYVKYFLEMAYQFEFSFVEIEELTKNFSHFLIKISYKLPLVKKLFLILLEGYISLKSSLIEREDLSQFIDKVSLELSTKYNKQVSAIEIKQTQELLLLLLPFDDLMQYSDEHVNKTVFVLSQPDNGASFREFIAEKNRLLEMINNQNRNLKTTIDVICNNIIKGELEQGSINTLQLVKEIIESQVKLTQEVITIFDYFSKILDFKTKFCESILNEILNNFDVPETLYTVVDAALVGYKFYLVMSIAIETKEIRQIKLKTLSSIDRFLYLSTLENRAKLYIRHMAYSQVDKEMHKSESLYSYHQVVADLEYTLNNNKTTLENIRDDYSKIILLRNEIIASESDAARLIEKQEEGNEYYRGIISVKVLEFQFSRLKRTLVDNISETHVKRIEIVIRALNDSQTFFQALTLEKRAQIARKIIDTANNLGEELKELSKTPEEDYTSEIQNRVNQIFQHDSLWHLFILIQSGSNNLVANEKKVHNSIDINSAHVLFKDENFYSSLLKLLKYFSEHIEFKIEELQSIWATLITIRNPTIDTKLLIKLIWTKVIELFNSKYIDKTKFNVLLYKHYQTNQQTAALYAEYQALVNDIKAILFNKHFNFDFEYIGKELNIVSSLSIKAEQLFSTNGSLKIIKNNILLKLSMQDNQVDNLESKSISITSLLNACKKMQHEKQDSEKLLIILLRKISVLIKFSKISIENIYSCQILILDLKKFKNKSIDLIKIISRLENKILKSLQSYFSEIIEKNNNKFEELEKLWLTTRNAYLEQFRRISEGIQSEDKKELDHKYKIMEYNLEYAYAFLYNDNASNFVATFEKFIKHINQVTSAVTSYSDNKYIEYLNSSSQRILMFINEIIIKNLKLSDTQVEEIFKSQTYSKMRKQENKYYVFDDVRFINYCNTKLGTLLEQINKVIRTADAISKSNIIKLQSIIEEFHGISIILNRFLFGLEAGNVVSNNLKKYKKLVNEIDIKIPKFNLEVHFIKKLKSISESIKKLLDRYADNIFENELTQFKLLNQNNLRQINYSTQVVAKKINKLMSKIIFNKRLINNDKIHFDWLMAKIIDEFEKIRSYNLSEIQSNIQVITETYHINIASNYFKPDLVSFKFKTSSAISVKEAPIAVKNFIQAIDKKISTKVLYGLMCYFAVIKNKFLLEDLGALLAALIKKNRTATPNNVLYNSIVETLLQINKCLRNSIKLGKSIDLPKQQLLSTLGYIRGFVIGHLTVETIKEVTTVYGKLVELAKKFSEIDIINIRKEFCIGVINTILNKYTIDKNTKMIEDTLLIGIEAILSETNIDVLKLKVLNYILSSNPQVIENTEKIVNLVVKLNNIKSQYDSQANILLNEMKNHLLMQLYLHLKNKYQLNEQDQIWLRRMLHAKYYIKHDINTILDLNRGKNNALIEAIEEQHEALQSEAPLCYALTNKVERFYCDIIIACKHNDNLKLLHYSPEKKWLNKLYTLAKDTCYSHLIINICDVTPEKIQQLITRLKSYGLNESTNQLLDETRKILNGLLYSSSYDTVELTDALRILNQLSVHCTNLPLFKQKFVPLIKQLLDFKVSYNRSLAKAKNNSYETSWFELVMNLITAVSSEFTMDSTQKLHYLNDIFNQIDYLDSIDKISKFIAMYSLPNILCQILLLRIKASIEQFLRNTMIQYEKYQAYFNTIQELINRFHDNKAILTLVSETLIKEISINDEVARITPDELVATLNLINKIIITESHLSELRIKSLLYWHDYLWKLQLEQELTKHLNFKDGVKQNVIDYFLRLEKIYGSDFTENVLQLIKAKKFPFKENNKLCEFLEKLLSFGWALASMAKEDRENLEFNHWENNLNQIEKNNELDLLQIMQATPTNDSISKRLPTIFDLVLKVNEKIKLFKSWEKQKIQTWLEGRKKITDQTQLEQDLALVELIAVLAQAVFLVYEYYPRLTQYIALFIYIDAFKQRRGRLGQISTGEGKSLITAMLAAVLTFLNKKVDVITSSSVLAIRDSVHQNPETGEINKLYDFFAILGLTVANNCDEACQKNPEMVKERYAADIVYGDCASFQRDILMTYFLGEDLISKRRSSLHDESNQNVLIVDEVDSMLLDKGNNVLYLSHEISDLRFLKSLYVYIWSGVNAPDVAALEPSDAISLVKNYIDMLLKEGHLVIPESLKKFYERRIEIWIEHALIAKRIQKDDNYIMSRVKEGMQVTVMDKDTGVEQSDIHWSHGLHQFLQLKHTQKLESESLKAVFMSSLSYFRLYTNYLYGLTGTLGSNAEQKLLSKVYSVDFFVLPRFKFRQYEEQKAKIFFEYESIYWFEAITKDVRKKIAKGRSVLIICESIAIVKQIEAYLQTISNANLKNYFSAFQKFDIGVDKRPLQTNDVIIATNLAGRGMDLKLCDDVKQAGGLHVITTYLPDNIRIEEQAFGRAARSGDLGSGRFIILTNINEKNIEKVKRIRDATEEQRLEQFRVRDLISNTLLETIFDRFHVLYRETETLLKNDILQVKMTDGYYSWTKEKIKNMTGNITSYLWHSKRLIAIQLDEQYVKFQLKSLLDHFAFWLDKEENAIKSSYLLGAEVIYQRYDKFESRMRALSQSPDIFKLVTMPNELNKLALYFYVKEYHVVAQRCFDKSILVEPNFAEMPFYYKAASLLKSKDYTLATRTEVKENLKKAKAILHERSNILQNTNQILIQIMLLIQQTGDGAYNNEFQKQITNECKIIQTFLGSIDEILGRNIFNCDFENIHGLTDEVKIDKFFEYVIQSLNIIRNYRLSENLQIINKKQDDGSNVKELVKVDKRNNKNQVISFSEEFRFYQEAIIESIENCSLNYENLESMMMTKFEFIAILKGSGKLNEAVSVDHVIVFNEEKIKNIKFRSRFLNNHHAEIMNILREFDNRNFSFEYFYDLFKDIEDSVKLAAIKNRLHEALKETVLTPIPSYQFTLGVTEDEAIIIPDDLKNKLKHYEKIIHYLFDLPHVNSTLDKESRTHSCRFRSIDIPLTDDKKSDVKKFWEQLIQQGVIKHPKLDVSLKDTEKESLIKNKLKQLEKEIKTSLSEQIIKEFGFVLDNDEYKKFIESIQEILKKTMGLIKSLPRIKVKEVNLEEYFQTGEFPPEIYEYQRLMFNHIISLVEKPPFWNWDAFAVAMLGLAQIAAGVALIVFTVGIGATIGEAFIAEGIGDIIFSIQSAIRGKFSWKEYAISKAISLAISVITLGISAAIQAAGKATKAAQAITSTLDTAEDIVTGTANVAVLSAGQSATQTASTVANVSKTVLFQGACKKVLSISIEKFGSFAIGIALDKIFDALPGHLQIVFEKQLNDALDYNSQTSSMKKLAIKYVPKYEVILNGLNQIESNLIKLYSLCDNTTATRVVTGLIEIFFAEKSQWRDRIVSVVGSLVKAFPRMMMDHSKDIVQQIGGSNSSVYAMGMIMRIAATVINDGYIAYKALAASADMVVKLADKVAQKNELLILTNEDKSNVSQINKESLKQLVEEHIKKIKTQIIDSLLKEFSKNILQAEIQSVLGFAIKNITDSLIKIPELEKISKNNKDEANKLMDGTEEQRNNEVDQVLSSMPDDNNDTFQLSDGVVDPNDSKVRQEIIKHEKSRQVKHILRHKEKKFNVFRDKSGALILDNEKSSLVLHHKKHGHFSRVTPDSANFRHQHVSKHGRQGTSTSFANKSKSIATNVSGFFTKSYMVSTVAEVGMNLIRLGGLVAAERLCTNLEYKTKCLQRERILIEMKTLQTKKSAEVQVEKIGKEIEESATATQADILLKKLETKQKGLASEIKIMEKQLKKEIYSQLAALIRLDEIRGHQDALMLSKELLAQCLATRCKIQGEVLHGSEGMLRILNEIREEYKAVILEKFPIEIAQKIEDSLKATSAQLEHKLLYVMHSRELKLSELTNTYELIQSNQLDVSEIARNQFTIT